MYCRDQHGTQGDAPGEALCADCADLLHYAGLRLEKCPFQEHKTTCAKCPVHCYKPARREQIRAVMRFAGPRMMFRHPRAGVLPSGDRRAAREAGTRDAEGRGGVSNPKIEQRIPMDLPNHPHRFDQSRGFVVLSSPHHPTPATLGDAALPQTPSLRERRVPEVTRDQSFQSPEISKAGGHHPKTEVAVPDRSDSSCHGRRSARPERHS